MPDIAIPKLLSARDVAEATGLSIWAVYDLVREGHIPHRRLGRKVVFSAQAT